MEFWPVEFDSILTHFNPPLSFFDHHELEIYVPRSEVLPANILCAPLVLPLYGLNSTGENNIGRWGGGGIISEGEMKRKVGKGKFL